MIFSRIVDAWRDPKFVQRLTAFGILTAAFTIIYFPFLKATGYIFSNADHLFFFSSFLASRRFGTLLDLQSFAFGQGFGLFQSPAIQHPFWWLFDVTRSAQIACALAEILMFAGILAYTLALRKINLYWAILIATVGTSLLFNQKILADYAVPADPQFYPQIGLAYFASAIFLGFGPRSTWWILAGIVMVFFVIVMDWQYVVFVLPVIGISTFAAIVTMDGKLAWKDSGWRADRTQTFIIVGFTFLLSIIILPQIYAAYDSFSLMSARMWGMEYRPEEIPHSLMFWGGLTEWKTAMFVAFSGTAAAIYYIVTDRYRLFLVSAGLICFILVLLYLDYDMAGHHVLWTLPAIGYFERPMIPLYAILVGLAVHDIASRLLARHVSPASPIAGKVAFYSRYFRDTAVGAKWLLVLMMCAAVVGLLIALRIASWHSDFKSLVFRQPIFWNRALDFTKTLPLPPALTPIYTPYFYEGTRELTIGHCRHLQEPNSPYWRYCANMLNLFSTPNILEFQNIVDVQYLVLHNQLQRTLHDYIASNGASSHLKSFGIRYVAVDGHLDQAVDQRTLGGKKVSFIDLGPIGPSDLSVQSVILANYDPNQAMDARFTNRAVVHDAMTFSLTQNLSPVEVAEFAYRQGSIVVRGRSHGNSLMLLPFQFSNCLSIETVGNESPARVVRVNGVQAALSFEYQADVVIKNEFRYFGDTKCRYQDFVDVARIGVFPAVTLASIAGDHRLPLLQRLELEKRLRQRDRLLAEAERNSAAATAKEQR